MDDIDVRATSHGCPTYSEDAISQLPALHLLQNPGWQYLTPDEAPELRGKTIKCVA